MRYNRQARSLSVQDLRLLATTKYRVPIEQICRNAFPPMTQEDLAAKLHKSRSTIAHYATGRIRVPIPVLLHLADLLGCHVMDLVTMDTNDGTPPPS